ncbi:MAG: hypothetical protein R3E02_14040 [Blastomonas sp.]
MPSIRFSTWSIFLRSVSGMENLQIVVPGSVATKTAIGEVCIQWARLEMCLLALLCQIEPMELQKAYTVFGGLDIRPRINMALNLIIQNKLPLTYVKRMKAVRSKVQDELIDRRNQVVHGGHQGEIGFETKFTMVRWKGEKQTKKVNAAEISKLAAEIHEVGSEVWAISEDLLARAIRKHMKVNLNNDFGRS